MAGQNPAFRLPAEPTSTAPGSEERIRVLEGRAKGGFALFHPDDRTLFDSASSQEGEQPCQTGP